MRFIVDECTGPRVAEWLGTQSHDVFSVYDQDRGATDEVVLQRAVAEDRIVITNDRDFGEMVFRDGREHRGVVFLRLADELTANKIRVLDDLIKNHANNLADHYVVVTDSQIRFAGPRVP